MVAFPGSPFCIHQQGKAVFKRKCADLVVRELRGKGFGHDPEMHFLQFSCRFIRQHALFPPLVILSAACKTVLLRLVLWLDSFF